MFGNSGAYLETPLRRQSPPPPLPPPPAASTLSFISFFFSSPHFQTPSVPTPSLTFPSFTGGRTPGVFVTPGGGILPSAGFGGDDRCAAARVLLRPLTRVTGGKKLPCRTKCCVRRAKVTLLTCCRCRKMQLSARYRPLLHAHSFSA
jgi:hypothetical protein